MLRDLLPRGQVPTAWTFTNKLQGTSLSAGDVIGCALDQGDYPVQASVPPRSCLLSVLATERCWKPTSGAESMSRSAIRSLQLDPRTCVVHIAHVARIAPYVTQGMPAGFQGIIKSVSMI
ncbi:MAG: hypothetical protein SGPRY_003656 [Prymnesium sp.]